MTNMIIKKIPVLICAVLLVAVVFRFYRLGDIPVGLHRDEAFLGYNAFSILKTGKDMSGGSFPLHLSSFLYSPAGYSYASIPFIGLFGLSAYSVRFASAFFGALTVAGVYWLGRVLWAEKAEGIQVGILSALLLTVLPWHVNLSRTATENTIVTFFIVMGVIFFIKGGRWLLLISYALFTLTLSLYQAPRAFLPMFIPVLFFLYPVDTKNVRRTAIILYALFIVLPVIIIMRSPELSLRIRTVEIFGNGEVQLLIDEQLREDGVLHIPPLFARVFHNKVGAYAGAIFENYTDHFSYRFLFTDEGKPDRYRVPAQGLLYLFMAPFFLYGMVDIVKKNRRAGLILICWMLLSPAGSALTFDDVPNMQRTLFIVPPIVIMTAYGMIAARARIRQLWLIPAYGACAIIVAYSVGSYIHAYLIHGVVHMPLYRQEGYEALVSTIHEVLPSYKKAIITNYESAPAIFFLFYTRYDPSLFHREIQDVPVTDYDRVAFGNYEFSEEQCPLRTDPKTGLLTGEEGILYVNYATCPVDQGMHEIRTISRSDGTDVFRVVRK